MVSNWYQTTLTIYYNYNISIIVIHRKFTVKKKYRIIDHNDRRFDNSKDWNERFTNNNQTIELILDKDIGQLC